MDEAQSHATPILAVSGIAYVLAVMSYMGWVQVGFFLWHDLIVVGAVVGLVGLGMHEQVIT